jgi:hypothetical protein
MALCTQQLLEKERESAASEEASLLLESLEVG